MAIVNQKQSNIVVWVPDFFCDTSLAPLRLLGVHLQFYPITRQMSPNLDVCRNLLNDSVPDLFLLVHYFGQPTEVDEVKVFCSNIGTWLIEDATHVFKPIQGVGNQGDCVIYSPHKHLPIPNGAVLLVRKNGPCNLGNDQFAMNAFQEIYNSITHYPQFSHIPAGTWLVKRLLQYFGIRNWIGTIKPFGIEKESNNSILEHPKISPLAKYLLSDLEKTLETIAEIRKRNKLLWDQAIAETIKQSVEIKSVKHDHTSYLAPYSFDDEREAETIFLHWLKAGLPACTWPDLAPEVTSHECIHSIAIYYRKTRIYLPVHQSISSDQINKCRLSLIKDTRLVHPTPG